MVQPVALVLAAIRRGLSDGLGAQHEPVCGQSLFELALRFLPRAAVIVGFLPVDIENDNPVTTLILGDLDGAARLLQDRLRAAARPVNGGDADRYGERHRLLADVNAAAGNIPANLVGELARFLHVVMGEQNAEFVALDPRRQGPVLVQLCQQLGELAEHFVTAGLVENLVDQREIVDVQH